MEGTWTLWNYFDVWGNEEDGWDVNDVCVEWCGLKIPENDREIINFLTRRLCFIKPEYAGIIRLDWTGEGWCEIVCDADEMPLGRLVREEN
jgi:hypothetical protein